MAGPAGHGSNFLLCTFSLLRTLHNALYLNIARIANTIDLPFRMDYYMQGLIAHNRQVL